MAPLTPERYALQVTINRTARGKLEYAQSLLGHRVPPGDVAQVLERALDALIAKLERTKFGATTRPRSARAAGNASSNPRYIPAAVKHAVWQRDGGQCTYMSAAGERCPTRERLEYDHVDPVALGGQPTVARLRLRCRAHNQYTAEQTFGAEFMKAKREAARRERAGRPQLSTVTNADDVAREELRASTP